HDGRHAERRGPDLRPRDRPTRAGQALRPRPARRTPRLGPGEAQLVRPAPDRTAAVDDALAVELPPFADPLVRTADPAHDTPFAVTGRPARLPGRAGRGTDIIQPVPRRARTKPRYRAAAAVGGTIP